MYYTNSTGRIMVVLFIASFILTSGIMFTLNYAENAYNELKITNVEIKFADSIGGNNNLVIEMIEFEIDDSSKIVKHSINAPKLKFKSKIDYGDIGLDLTISDENYNIKKSDKDKVSKIIKDRYVGQKYSEVYP